MKITRVETLFFKSGSADDWLFVKISTDEGLVGYGEASNAARIAATAVEELGSRLVGLDPGRIEEHWQSLYRVYHNVRGGPIATAAISGIEIALWDIKGKALGVPVYELLGGRFRERLRAYGNGWSQGVNSPETAAEAAARAVEQGYRALKWDPFGPVNPHIEPERLRESIAQIRAVRAAVGPDVELLIEAHGKLNVNNAIRAGRMMEAYDPYFFEEPVDPENVDAMVKVAAEINVPVATGERLYTKFGFRELLAKQAADIIQPDVCHTGGILETKKIAAMAEAYYVPIAPHNPFGPINTAAAIQVDACTPNFLIQEMIIRHLPTYRQLLTEPLEPRDGYLEIPTRPGIGYELNEEFIRRQQR
ncbi:MAG: galactonate dehydratase [Chloroflexota bacterium]